MRERFPLFENVFLSTFMSLLLYTNRAFARMSLGQALREELCERMRVARAGNSCGKSALEVLVSMAKVAL